MSALAGIRYFDRRPVSDEVIAALSRFNRLRGPHSYGTFVDPGIAVIACGLHFDALSHVDKQPVMAASGLMATFDGRLDNRDNFTMRYRRALGNRPSDSALVAHHLQNEGENGLVDLVGDFSVALWDCASRTLTLARDYMGNRPLYYVRTSSYVAWSTCLETLVRFEHVEERLEDNYIAGVLTFGPPVGLTPFAGILKVPANAIITVSDTGRLSQRELWNFAAGTIRYRRHESYVEHMRALLDEAVRCRMRAEAPVWADLSGGLDSSGIVALAQHQVDARLVDAPALHTFSRVFPASPESDERPFIEAVRRWTGCRGDQVEDGADFRDLMFEATFCPFRMDGSYRYMLDCLSRTRSVVWLSGGLGDLIMGKTLEHSIGLMDHLWEDGVSTFARRTFEYAHFMNDTLFHVWASLLRQHSSPERVIRRRHIELAKASGLTDAFSDTAIAEHFGLSDSFVRRTKPRPLSLVDHLEDHPVSKRHVIFGLRYWSTTNFGLISDSLYGSRMTYPYMHRPLVEFILSIPTSIMWKPGRPRALMRSALRSALPPVVIERQDKGYASPVIARLLRPPALAMLHKPVWRVVEAGYVDRGRYESTLKRLIDGRRLVAGSEEILRLEAWLGRAPKPALPAASLVERLGVT